METNLALGITFVFLCGLSVMLGNLALFGRRNGVPSSSVLSDPTVLAMTLGLAAGVMIFVSFGELFHESQHKFDEAGFENPFIYATVCLFLGSLFTALLDVLVHLCGHTPHAHGQAEDDLLLGEDAGQNDFAARNDYAPLTPATTALDPSKSSTDLHSLKSMTLLTSLSLALHNLPEGLGVLVATTDEPSVGATLAVAVALHNIPLGLSIVMSLWVTDRSVWKCVLVTFLVGLAQPIGGIIGYYLLEEIFTGTAEAVLYGGVAGTMIYVAMKELLPTASTYDKTRKFVTPCFFFGMMLVALTMWAAGGH